MVRSHNSGDWSILERKKGVQRWDWRKKAHVGELKKEKKEKPRERVDEEDGDKMPYLRQLDWLDFFASVSFSSLEISTSTSMITCRVIIPADWYRVGALEVVQLALTLCPIQPWWTLNTRMHQPSSRNSNPALRQNRLDCSICYHLYWNTQLRSLCSSELSLHKPLEMLPPVPASSSLHIPVILSRPRLFLIQQLSILLVLVPVMPVPVPAQ